VNKAHLKIFFLSLTFIFVQAKAQDTSPQCSIKTGSVLVEQSKVHYFGMGSGKPVLLLHGLFAQKEQWTDFACQLAIAGYAVYAPDLPGYGQSLGFPVESYRLSKEVDLIHEFTQKLHLANFAIAGNSMGGAIAAMFTQKYPKEVESVAFIGAPMGIIGWSPQIRSAIYSGVNPFIPITPNQFDLEMSLLFFKPPVIANSIKQDAIAAYVKDNRHYQQVWDIVNLDIAVLETYKELSKPAFIAWGRDDGVFNIAGKTLLDQKYVNKTSYEIPNAAHLIMLEKPKAIADLYIEFLRSK
jgi:abhydrolase domain-containing protein 6